jgi:hypothetical protein
MGTGVPTGNAARTRGEGVTPNFVGVVAVRPVSLVRFLNLSRKGSEAMGPLGGAWARPFSKGLILAQNERWRRGLGMQVVRAARPVAQG